MQEGIEQREVAGGQVKERGQGQIVQVSGGRGRLSPNGSYWRFLGSRGMLHDHTLKDQFDYPMENEFEEGE